jgi:hypothetical protein
MKKRQLFLLYGLFILNNAAFSQSVIFPKMIKEEVLRKDLI